MNDNPTIVPVRVLEQPAFLPMNRMEMEKLGWAELDVLLLSGDAYVDHPSFAASILGRWLVAHGFRVGVLAQPAWAGERAAQDFSLLPRPRLFAGVSAGAMDSMLAHSTAFRKKRHDDAYTPGGQNGARPNRASIVYTGLLRRFFPGLPVVLGGIEASLRRVSHYDFWTDSLRRSILLDSKADILLYGMGERALLELARLAEGLLSPGEQAQPGHASPGCGGEGGGGFRKALAEAARSLPGAGTALGAEELKSLNLPELQELPSHEEMEREPYALLQATLTLEREAHQGRAFLSQRTADRMVLLAPPSPPLREAELDRLYGLPFARLPHPSYRQSIPAWEMIRTSITTHRGCAGGCSFCSIALHQGRIISSRSRESVLREAAAIVRGPAAGSGAGEKTCKAAPKWAGAISDVGGPSANMWRAVCAFGPEKCLRKSCLFPEICKGFQVRQTEAVSLLREVAALPGARHVRVASGVRFDLLLREPEALIAYTTEFTGGQLKVAPEHICQEVLDLMRKPGQKLFESFIQTFAADSRAAGKEQYVIPYLISAFPGCTEAHMHELKDWLRRKNWSPRQVQCFIPTPGTMATAMYYCGKNEQGEKIYVARTDKERLRQHYILLGEEKPAQAGSGKKNAGRGTRGKGASAGAPRRAAGLRRT